MRYSIYLLSMLLLVNLAGADVLINEMLANPATDWNDNGQVGGMETSPWMSADTLLKIRYSGRRPQSTRFPMGL